MDEVTFTRNSLDTDMQWIYDSRQMDFNKCVTDIEHYCDVPFITINVDKQGRVFNCGCQHWLPISIGNILDFSSINEVFASPKATAIRDTILDRTYRYCDLQSCDLKDRLRENPELSYFKGDNIPHTQPVRLVMNIDESCNLTCPSCRTEFKFDKEGETFDFKMKLSNHLAKLVDDFDGQIQFEVAGDGDPFASAIYRNFISQIKFKRPESYCIVNTNGLLLRDHWAVMKNVEHQTNTIKISVDAGSENVYNITRRLGQWSKLLRNIEWLVHYKREHHSKFFIATNFVVQKENVHDIKNYVRLMSRLGVDVIYLQKVTDWGTWGDKFAEQAVWKSDHPLYDEMTSSLELIKDMPKVQLTNLLEYAKT